MIFFTFKVFNFIWAMQASFVLIVLNNMLPRSLISHYCYLQATLGMHIFIFVYVSKVWVRLENNSHISDIIKLYDYLFCSFNFYYRSTSEYNIWGYYHLNSISFLYLIPHDPASILFNLVKLVWMLKLRWTRDEVLSKIYLYIQTEIEFTTAKRICPYL